MFWILPQRYQTFTGIIAIFGAFSKDGQVVEQWFTVDQEKVKSNLEVLEKLENEVDEDEKQNVQRLLNWAKSTKKTKTNTMVIREKKRDARIR